MGNVVGKLVFLSCLLFCNLGTFVQAEEPLGWRGSWQQGGLLLGTVPKGYSVEYQKKPLKISREGFFLLGLGRDAESTVMLTVIDAQGNRILETFDVSSREYQIQRIEGVPQHTVTPPDDVLERIRHESALVKKARSMVSDSEDFLVGFSKPIEGRVTGIYGSQRIYNGVPKSPHYGVDYAAPTGENVMAPAAGIVRLAHGDMFYSGGTLIIEHGHGLSSSFLHLSKIHVQEGDRIEGGDIIGEVGATGRATGPHLDWRMNWHQVRIDPALVLKHFPVSK